MAQEVLTSFSCNCGYDISFISTFFNMLVASEYCLDKNSILAELSLKLLAVLIQSVNIAIMQLNSDTLTSIMRCLSSLIEGKKQNMKLSALDICMYICNSINCDNYLQLMQFCLKENEFHQMGV